MTYNVFGGTLNLTQPKANLSPNLYGTGIKSAKFGLVIDPSLTRFGLKMKQHVGNLKGTYEAPMIAVNLPQILRSSVRAPLCSCVEI